MPQESEITPFDSNLSSSSPPLSKSARMRRVAHALKWAGLAGFWVAVGTGSCIYSYSRSGDRQSIRKKQSWNWL